MITPEKLAIWRKFGGDADGWHRQGRPEQDVIGVRDWDEIRNMVQQVTLVKKGFASQDYAKAIQANLSAMTSDVNVAQNIYDLA